MEKNIKFKTMIRNEKKLKYFLIAKPEDIDPKNIPEMIMIRKICPR